MRLRRTIPLLGGALLAPLFVVLPTDMTLATPTPVSGTESQVTLVDASRPEAAAAAKLSTAEVSEARRQVATDTAGAKSLPQDGVRVLKATAPQPVNQRLAAVAVTWTQGDADQVALQIRTKKNGNWGAWENLTVDNSAGPDPDKAPKSGRKGSELYMVSGASEVQSRVLGKPGSAPVEPALTVIDPGKSDADAAPATSRPGSAHAVTPRPNIYTRAQWGADESWRTGRPESNNPRGIVIHHTADTNNYSADMVPGMMRSMYRYATKTLGWDDIAYNFVIDRWGRIWQGRAWLYPDQPVFPAAQLSNNDRGVGISMLGNYEQEVLSSAARSSLVKLLAWKSSLHGINPLGSATWFNNKSGRYETMPAINGHRDHYYTACPGANLYPLIPGIRREVAALVGNSSSAASTVFRDFDGMGDSDILGRNASGQLTLSSPDGAGSMTAMERIGGGGWQGFDVVTVVGDWNGDGNADIIARHAATADLILYPGDGKGSFLAPSRIGVGWGQMQTLVAPGDWDGDGKPDIIATNRTNWDMYFYGGDGRGGFSRAGVRIGYSWGAIKSFAGVGSWNGDGKPALAAVTVDGLGVMYYGDGRGGFASQVNQPGNWAAYGTLTGVSNAYGDKRAGVLAVSPEGATQFGVRGADGKVAWKPTPRSFAGYYVYGG